MSGYFKLYRRIFESDIWMNPDKLRFFIYLIGQARFKKEPNTKYKNNGIIIKRGQFLRSYRKLQEDLEYYENNAVRQYSLSKIKRMVSELEKEDRIKTEKTQLGTLFTIVNYLQYQDLGEKENGSLEQAWNRVGTDLEQTWNNTVRMEKECSKNGESSCSNIAPAYEKVFCRMISPHQKEILESFIEDGMEKETVIFAIKYCGEKDADGFAYLKKVLNSWLSDGVKTIQDAKHAIERFEGGKGNGRSGNNQFSGESSRTKEESFSERIDRRALEKFSAS